MNDRELLELAAKAAGISGVIKSICDGGFYLLRDDRRRDEEDSHNWSPLNDDGDALRLAVKLRLKVEILPEQVRVHDRQGSAYYDDADPDLYTNTRRAIVRAAAEIGRNL